MGRLSVALTGTVATALIMAATGAQSASRVAAGGVTVTFTLAGGSLGVAPMAALAPGGVGGVRVIDSRGVPGAAWAVSVTSTKLDRVGAAADAAGRVSGVWYAPGAVTAANVVTAARPAVALGRRSQRAVTGWAGRGVTTATWYPRITIPTDLAAGGTVTVTQSVF